jgi:transposase
VVIEGATARSAFEAYVGEVLGPTLVEGQVVILDNLGTHKGDRVRELIEGRGCKSFRQ